MKTIDADSSKILLRSFSILLVFMCSLGMLLRSMNLLAQDPNTQYTTVTSVTDGSTPTGLAPGSPAGSYPLSGFESVNPFNGGLSFHLPLAHVGGRGQVGYDIPVRIETKWRVVHSVIYDAVIGVQHEAEDQVASESYTPVPGWWSTQMPTMGLIYSAGALEGRQAGYDKQPCALSPVNLRMYRKTLTRLTFTLPDGTEYELRDKQSQGRPWDIPSTTSCGAISSRGRVFETADGSSATFIKDDDPYNIFDSVDINETSGLFTPSGYLFLRDGTRYRIQDGAVTSIRDRNGNQITTGNTITDALGRAISISHVTNPQGEMLYDSLSLLDRTGTPWKTIQVNYAFLHDVLRSGFSIMTYHDLFPYLDADPYNSFDDQVVSSVVLPNNQSYQFRYNSYGELARVVLPTGGAIEYDYADGYPSISYQVYRRVVERREYPDGGTGNTYKSRTTFSQPQLFSQPQSGILVVVNHWDSNVPNPALLASEAHYFYGDPSASIQDTTGDPTRYPDFTEGKEFKTEEGSPALRRVENTWAQLPPPVWLNPQGIPFSVLRPNNPYITDATVTLLDTNQVSTQHFEYDQYNNRTVAEDHDWGTGALLRRTETTYLTADYDTLKPDTTNPDASLTTHIRDLPSVQTVINSSGNAVAQTQYVYDVGGLSSSGAVQLDAVGAKRGNATAVKRCLSTAPFNPSSCPALLSTYHQYDDAGNVVQTTDPRGYSTTFSYADSWGNSNCAPPSGNAAGYLTTTTTPATPNVPAGLVTHYTYDSCRGKPTSLSDPNNQTTAYAYNDLLDRLTQATFPNGGTTSFVYHDSLLNVETLRDLNSPNDHAVRTKTVYDGLGRVIQTQLESDPQGTVYVDTTYDAMGRKATVSNPYRSGNDATSTACHPAANSTNGTTTYQYDALSRITSMIQPDGSVAGTSYQGNRTTATDEAGKVRQSFTDGLGRLSQVIEDPAGLNYLTTYTYDVLDDLTGVNQNGQTRSFVYDSLKRLTSATNPESGTTLYSLYDGNGNLLTKTDARGVTTHYTYDALNRITGKSYDIPPSSGVASTASVSYCYDTATYGIGRLRSVTQGSACAGDGSYYDVYDLMGRVKTAHQVTDGQTYGSSLNPSYAYNLQGQLTSETYPSGRTITVGYDTAGRTNAVAGALGGVNTNYVQTIAYAPPGGMTSMALGNTLTETRSYNNRLQPTSICLGNWGGFNYDFGSGSNNGNVVSQTMTALSQTQTYSYDHVNRLTQVSESSGWNQTYGYDPYGNRNYGYSSAPDYLPVQVPNISTGNNKIAATNYNYDAAGNLTQGLGSGGSPKTYTYDAENRLTNFNGEATYVYDGDGRRVKKMVGSTTSTVYAYDAMGQLVAEYSNATPSIGGTQYITADHLGSTRVVTNASGGVVSRHDFLPFGETIPTGIGGRSSTMGYEQPDGINQKFTAKERDSESGLDYFLARYHGSMMGRFMSPDPMFMNDHHLFDPQELNLYSYVRNNPLALTDPTGLDIWLKGCGKDSKTCHKGYVGTWDKDHKHFERTHLSGNLTDSATLGRRAVIVNYNKGTYQGVWDTNKGENNAVQVAGAGALSAFIATINGNCNGSCVVSGSLSVVAGNGKENPLISGQVMAALEAAGSGYQRNAGFDAFDLFHREANGKFEVNYRGYLPDDPEGLPSTHIPVPVSPGQGVSFHVDTRYPYEDAVGFAEHTGSVVKTIVNTLFH
jgi:RHS repeat-associated protein